jgi:hypothetical protein
LELSIRKNDVVKSHFDGVFAYCSNVAVGEFGMFFVVDLDVGLSIAFRIDYQEQTHSQFYEVARLDSDAKPRTYVSDFSQLGATFCESLLTLWHLSSGVVHRMLKFDTVVTAVAWDWCFNGLFVGTRDRISYLNVNGDILCASKLGTPVTSCLSLNLPLAEMRRCAMCGMSNGEVWLVSPAFDRREMELRRLDTRHRADVVEWIPHRSKSGVASVDKDGNVCLWSCVGLRAPKLKYQLFMKCTGCELRPVTACPRCNRALCEQCSHGHSPGRCTGLDNGN